MSRVPPESDWKRGFPGLQEFQRWKLPAGTIIVAENATVIYPNGTVDGWGSVQRRVGKQTAPEPSKPEPLTEETAAAPSPELLAALRRKAWLKKREEEGDPPPDASDPQAWRFETADTQG